MKKLLIISGAPLIVDKDKYFAYSPYVNELDLWAKHSDEIYFCCPIWSDDRNLLNKKIDFRISDVYELDEFSIQSSWSSIRAIKSVFINLQIIFQSFRHANHIHLRCPSNVGLLACIVQIFFPHKIKSAKYAGNWDPKAKQPWSYKIQRWILSNTFLTRNMKVLVYGDWADDSPNIKPFFTATYSNQDKEESFYKESLKTAHFIFVGTLSEGKRPLYVLQLIKRLYESGLNLTCEFYGEGSQRELLENFIKNYKLSTVVTLMGNCDEAIVKSAYQKSHFLILPSKSEGWPKVIAEAMFWGCIPITTLVSCVPFMINNGERGVPLTLNEQKDAAEILRLLKDLAKYDEMRTASQKWSRLYTTENFESGIAEILSEIKLN